MMKKHLYVVLGFVVLGSAAYIAQSRISDVRHLSDAHPKKKVRVYASMVADLFHYGHVNFLRKARAEGDYLIVGLISDEETTPYKRKPLLSLDERVKVVQGCRYVDEVLPNAPLEATEEWITKHNIDIVVHGDDFDQSKINKFFSYPYKKGMLRIVPYTSGISTSELIARIKTRIANGEL